MAVFQGGLFGYEAQSDTFKPHLEAYGATSILQDSSGEIWVGTTSIGLLHYNVLTGNVRQYTIEQGLATILYMAFWSMTIRISGFQPEKELPKLIQKPRMSQIMMVQMAYLLPVSVIPAHLRVQMASIFLGEREDWFPITPGR